MTFHLWRYVLESVGDAAGEKSCHVRALRNFLRNFRSNRRMKQAVLCISCLIERIQKVSVRSGWVCSSPDSLIKSFNLVSSWVWRHLINFVKSCFWIILIHLGLLVNSAHLDSNISACGYLESAHFGFYCSFFFFFFYSLRRSSRTCVRMSASGASWD